MEGLMSNNMTKHRQEPEDLSSGLEPVDLRPL
jgi:hypothetical protein